MTDLFDYLAWRGDLSLEQSPFNCVDALVLSILCYLDFVGAVEGFEAPPTPMEKAARLLLARPEGEPGARSEIDRRLLRALAASPRYKAMRLTGYESRLEPTREMQFAALTILTGDGAAFAAYRGTDNTLIGWKEDLNMSFAPVVQGQRQAESYLERLAARHGGPLRVGGHSKGGNLAVYAAAFCPPQVQSRIAAVYDNDGPGFCQEVLQSQGYRTVLSRVQAFVPQSSVVGMMMNHAESYTVVRSAQMGIMQHDPYSWQVLGSDFIRLEKVTAGSRFVDDTLKTWIANLDPEEQSRFIDTVFEVLGCTGAVTVRQLVSPRNAKPLVKAMSGLDEETRGMMVRVLAALGRAAKHAAKQAAGEVKLPTRQRLPKRQEAPTPQLPCEIKE